MDYASRWVPFFRGLGGVSHHTMARRENMLPRSPFPLASRLGTMLSRLPPHSPWLPEYGRESMAPDATLAGILLLVR
jgi:hypothetical protein